MMLTDAVVSLALLLGALLTGALFGVFLMFNPNGLDGPSYVSLHQHGVRRLNTPMPALGIATFVASVAAALLLRDAGVRFGLMAAAAVMFLVPGLVTRIFSQPINTEIMAWPAGAPPEQWTQLRDEWWVWHLTRLVFGLAGLALVILAAVTR